MPVNRKIRITEAQALVTGLPTYCTNMVFVLGGKTYSVAEAVALATDYAKVGNATILARAAYHATCVAERAALATEGVTFQQLRENLALAFSNSPQTLADLRIPPKKPRNRLTGEARAARDAKARATRIARGTTSKKQKAAIKGNVTGVEIVPLTTGTAAAAPSTASSSSSGTATMPGVPVLATGTTAHT